MMTMATFLIYILLVTRYNAFTVAVPTISNETGQYYFDFFYLNNRTIYCTHNKLCHIDGLLHNSQIVVKSNVFTLDCFSNGACSGIKSLDISANKTKIRCSFLGCTSVTFNLTQSMGDITFECGSEGCGSATLRAINQITNTINIKCTGSSSCDGAIFQLGDSSSVNMLCDFASTWFDAACYNAHVYAQNVTNMKLICGKTDCTQLDLYCPALKGDSCTLHCKEASGCSQTTILAPFNFADDFLNVITAYELYNTKFQCYNKSIHDIIYSTRLELIEDAVKCTCCPCCPFGDQYGVDYIYTFEEEEACVVDSSNTDDSYCEVKNIANNKSIGIRNVVIIAMIVAVVIIGVVVVVVYRKKKRNYNSVVTETYLSNMNL